MKISTRIFSGFFIILLLFALVTLINIKLSEEVNTNSDWLRKSSDVIRTSNALQRNIVELENGLMNFLLTGEESSLEPYYESQRKSNELFKELEILISQEKFQMEELQKIKRLLNQWESKFAKPFIEIKREAGKSDAGKSKFNSYLKTEIKNNSGGAISDKIRASFKEIHGFEYKLRKDRQQKLKESINKTSTISGVSILLAIVLGLATAYYTTNMISSRINKMVTAAEQISKGDFKIVIEDNASDELNKLSSSLKIMALKLDQGFSELNQFAHIVSHDLKAPLRGIENVIRWMEEDNAGSINPEIKTSIDLIKNRTKRMENFIEGILALSRIDKVNNEISEVKVSEVLEEVIEFLNPPASIKIHYSKMPVLQAERIYLHQIFQNLISNSIKYNNKGHGNIWISATDMGEDFEFTVKDDGPGIDPEYHEKIFLVFQTLQERDAFESTGIGLTIVKKIIEKKHGSIRVISETGKGASFIFRWPKRTINLKNS
jgi:signal transduction histidine kinase